jgi:hypothetical protein
MRLKVCMSTSSSKDNFYTQIDEMEIKPQHKGFSIIESVMQIDLTFNMNPPHYLTRKCQKLN